jgi:hypothetical protein
VPRLGVARVGEVGALLALAGPCAPFGLGGFEDSDVDFLAGGLRGLSTFGDSLSTGTFFVGEAKLMSWGTLHRSSRVTR